jgi:hypothetical protein
MSSMLFSEAFARLAGSVAVSVLWQGALVGLVVSLLLARTKSPRARHTLACLGLLVMAALLPVNFIGSASMGSEAAVPARFATSDLVTSPTDTAPLPGSVAHQSALATAPPAGAAAPPSPSPAAEREPRPRLTAAQWYHYSLPWLGRVWAAGILLFETMQGRSFVALIALGIASLPFVTALVSAVSGAQALTRTHPTVSAGAVRGHGLRPLGRQGLPRQSRGCPATTKAGPSLATRAVTCEYRRGAW